MSAVTDLQGLSDLSQCAYALGMAFGREAQAAGDEARRLRYYELFERCFHGFRVAVALKLRLARMAPGRERETAEARDACERSDPPEHDRRDPSDPSGRQRLDDDRDREAASLPVLLQTLGDVVADAQRLPGPPPAELPTLRELLARMASPAPTGPGAARKVPPPAPKTIHEGVAGVAVLVKPAAPVPATARSRLLQGSAPTLLTDLARGRGGQPGRATGPPAG